MRENHDRTTREIHEIMSRLGAVRHLQYECMEGAVLLAFSFFG